MIKRVDSKREVESAIIELNAILDKYVLPDVYRSYISFIAWKMKKDSPYGHKASHRDSE